MKFCKYCGQQLEDEWAECTACGRHVGAGAPPPPQDPAPAQRAPEGPAQRRFPLAANKKLLAVVLAAVVVGCAVFYFMGQGKCRYTGCDNRAVEGSDWCYAHKCAMSGCSNMRYSSSNYCSSHYVLYDDDYVDYSRYVFPSQLSISEVTLSSSGSYTVAEGKITNNSDYTVTFVKIKGAFEDSWGDVIDTDWTYAVGSEGLAPGESCKWRMSVEKDYAISDCSVTVYDFDY